MKMFSIKYFTYKIFYFETNKALADDLQLLLSLLYFSKNYDTKFNNKKRASSPSRNMLSEGEFIN